MKYYEELGQYPDCPQRYDADEVLCFFLERGAFPPLFSLGVQQKTIKTKRRESAALQKEAKRR